MHRNPAMDEILLRIKEGIRRILPGPSGFREFTCDELSRLTGLDEDVLSSRLPGLAYRSGARVEAVAPGLLRWCFPSRLSTLNTKNPGSFFPAFAYITRLIRRRDLYPAACCVSRIRDRGMNTSYDKIPRRTNDTSQLVARSFIRLPFIACVSLVLVAGYAFALPFAILYGIMVLLEKREDATMASFPRLIRDFVFGSRDPESEEETVAARSKDFLAWAGEHQGYVHPFEYGLYAGLKG